MIVASPFFSTFSFVCVCVCLLTFLILLGPAWKIITGGRGVGVGLKFFIGHCHSQLLFQDTQQSVTCVLYQTDNILVSSGAMDG